MSKIILMKRVAVTALIALSFVGAVQAAQFSSWLTDYDRSHPMASMIAHSRYSSPLPDTSVVGVPPVPGARVVMHMGVNSPMYKQMTSGGQKMLPAMTMVSGKSEAEIIAYYKKHAKGYQFVDSIGGKMFIRSKKKLNSQSADFIRLMMTTPHITVSAIPSQGPRLVRWGKSMIQISYRP